MSIHVPATLGPRLGIVGAQMLATQLSSWGFSLVALLVHLRPTQASLAQVLTQPAHLSSSYSHFPFQRSTMTHSNTLLGKEFSLSSFLCIY